MNFMQLFESSDDKFWVDNKTATLIEETLEKIVNLHPDFMPNPEILQISLTGYDSTNSLGLTRFFSENGIKNIHISVCRYVLRNGLEDLFINTFVHEYCHYLVNMDMLNDPRVTFKTGTEGNNVEYETPELEKYYRADGGHGECWLKYADMLSKELNLKYKITAHPQEPENKIYHDCNKDQIVFSIGCVNNDIEPEDFYEKHPDSIFKYSPYTANMLLGILMGEVKCKQCGGDIVLKFVSKEYEDLYYDALKEILFKMALKAAFGF